MKNKSNAKLLMIAFILTLVVIVGTTYAWLNITRKSEVINKITAGNLELTLDDTTSEGIKLIKAIPMSYQQGIKTEEYTFTLTNKSSASSYVLSLKDLTTYTNDEDQEVTIADEDRLADSKVRYILLKDGEEATASKSKILTDRVIDSGTIEKGQTIKYSLRIWIDSKAGDNNTEEEVMGKVFNAQLSLEATQTVTPTKTAVCKRATTLHTEICASTHCSGEGYTSDGSMGTTTITYGNLGTKGVLTTGDAFDCDVNGDGVYDSTTERFYYVSDMTNGITTDSNIAVLVYYNNVSGGVASNSNTYAYDEAGNSYENGPATVSKQLPTTEQWKNVGLTNVVRDLTDEKGTVRKSVFSYAGYAARLLTYQEVERGCYDGVTAVSSIGGLSTKCKYLMENTRYSDINLLTYGEWLETPFASYSGNAMFITSDNRYIVTGPSTNKESFGARPAIEVAKTDMEY